MGSNLTRNYRNAIEFLKRQAYRLKLECYTLMHVYRDRETKWFVKLIIVITLGYALSPIDLIPDFIPILGYLDDLILLPLLIGLSIKLIPTEIYQRSQEKAQQQIQSKTKLKKNAWPFAFGIISIYIILFSWILYRLKNIFFEQN